MRIVVLSNIGLGLFKFRQELLKELCREHEVFFCIPRDEFVPPLERLGSIFVDNPWLERHGTNPVQEWKLFRFYVRRLKALSPDVVLTYTVKPNIYGGLACAHLGVPYIANVTGLGLGFGNGGLLQKTLLILYRLGLRKAQKVFFQNQDNLDFLVGRGVVSGNVELLPGSGVNLVQYPLLPYPSGDTVDFAFVARVMKEKGIDQYLDAAAAIRQRHPETRFHVCGFCEEAYEGQLKRLHSQGTVIYHGLVSDMVEIYKTISCTVLPTYYSEGLNNVLLESAACGRPIITTDRAGCREVIDDGVNGFIVRQQDSQDLIDKIERFLGLSVQKREAMGRLGRGKVEREFDREIVVRKYQEEIAKVK
jgi:galacturonosyltransferase